MQMAQGEPGAMVSGWPAAWIFSTFGVAPIAGFASGGNGTLMRISRSTLPSPSNTWMRRFPRAAAEMLAFPAAAIVWGGVWLPRPGPGLPEGFHPVSFFLYLG